MLKQPLSYLAILSAAATILTTSALAAPEGRSERLIEKPRIAESALELKPHIGIYAGAAGQNGDGYRTDATFMADVGLQPIVPFGFALQAQYSPSRLNAPGPDVSFNTTNILLKETLNFGGTIPVLRNSFVGLKNGLTVYSGDVETIGHFSFGPTLGFDIPLASQRNISLGAEATYLAVIGDSDASTPDQTSVLGAMKFWF